MSDTIAHGMAARALIKRLYRGAEWLEAQGRNASLEQLEEIKDAADAISNEVYVILTAKAFGG